MTIPNILALDFDGVLCDGVREYFETSRRTYKKVWPEEGAPDQNLFATFKTLRPVIMTGWEMPVLLRGIIQGYPESRLLHDWETIRDELIKADRRHGEALVRELTCTLDQVRYDWIATDRQDWLKGNSPYCSLEDARRILTDPELAVIVTTKEGAVASQILAQWGIQVADIQGKEAGIHKCENLRTLIIDYTKAHGQRPRLWFVEDRLETLQHVTTHPDLEDVGLFLAVWGYNTPEKRATIRDNARIRLLTLEQFRSGLVAWQ